MVSDNSLASECGKDKTRSGTFLDLVKVVASL